MPLGTTLDQMLAMIDDLRANIGEENVHVDDKIEEVAGQGLFSDNPTAGQYRDGHDVQPGTEYACLAL